VCRVRTASACCVEDSVLDMFAVILTGGVGRCLFAATDQGWMVCCVACCVKKK